MRSVSGFTRTRPWRAAIAGIAVLAGLLSVGLQPATAATEALTYQFAGPPDAIYPEHGLVKGPDGFYYGVTYEGGNVGLGNANGAIYQLKPPTVGHPAWQESVIWSFHGGAKGQWPNGPLVFGANGTAYGVTLLGGDLVACGEGCGTVYSIVPPAPGKKLGKFAIIHQFHHVNGTSPSGALVFDSQGNLYGTTQYGGNDNYCTGECGVVFKLSPPAPGKVAWKQLTIYQFQHAIGAVPNGGLIFDATGNTLYGTTEGGGNGSAGVAFSLTKPKPGHFLWSYGAIYHFLGVSHADGNWPYSGLVADASGNLYGTTQLGGDKTCGNSGGCGIAFELSASGGVWSETILHTFEDYNDGRNPYSGLTLVGQTLYGTTTAGGGDDVGCGNGCGTVYKIALSPSVSYGILHTFQNITTDGIIPRYANLLWDGASTLYGTTFSGGKPFHGTVYSLTVP